MESSEAFWRRCSNCKSPIPFGARYWMCSVSSCSKVRAPTQFCKPDCWAVHEEVAFHKNAWAVENKAPLTADAEPAEASTPPRVASPSTPASSSRAASGAGASPSGPGDGGGGAEHEVLVVVSRLKELIKKESNGMSTSDQVLEPFSDQVRRLADQGIESAKRNNRKTILDRDIPQAGPKGDVDVLVVVSKLKDYVRKRSDLRTSDEVPAAISQELRRLALFAIENARKDGRKTVMGRDVPQ
jgi:histone H3/H4